MKEIYVCFIVVLTLVSCGGNVRETVACDKNWFSVGEEAALAGKSVRKFYDYKEACGDSAGDDAKNAYIDGWTQGIIKFCTYKNGYELGLSNNIIKDICPYELRSDFERGQKTGKLEFDVVMHRMQRDGDEAADQANRNSQQEDRGMSRQ